MRINDPSVIGQAIAAEVMGSFFLAFLYLTQTEEKTKLSKDPAITTLIIAAAYVAAICMSSPPNDSMSCLNPAIGISTVLVMVFNSNSTGIKWIWIYGAFPFLGGILAVIFHELVFKKVQATIVESEEDADGILDKTDS